MINPTATPYKLSNAHIQFPSIDRSTVLARAYSVFILALGIVLTLIGLRIFLALLVISGPVTTGVTYLTDLPVSPFNSLFHDMHAMLQISTGAAFTAYYLFYWVVTGVHSVVKRFERPRYYAKAQQYRTV